MRKAVILCAVLSSTTLFAQKVDFGIKAGLAYNADAGAIQSATETYENKGEGRIGWQAGLFSRIHLGGIYLQPEILYTSFDNEYVLQNGSDLTITKNRIDVPLHLGVKFLGFAHLQAGPVFSYYLTDTNSRDIIHATQDEFNIGFQLGAGFQISQILVNARYEMGIGKMGSSFLEKSTNTQYNTENRPNILNVTIGYLF